MTTVLFPEQLERITGYSFRDKSLLLRALTRLAYSKEQGLSEDSHLDALATLGDAVIELIILARLVKGGEHDKGAVSLKKMDLVNMSVLRDAARSIHLEQYVRWGKGGSDACLDIRPCSCGVYGSVCRCSVPGWRY